MSSAEFLSSRPLSVSIPAGPYCPRRPALREILANSAPPPWTLSAFMAYLSQNHCLETLEFTMDASRYHQHYDTMMQSNPGGSVSPASNECDYVKMLWRKLLDAYIVPNGPREVNLPSDVRDGLLSLPRVHLPPHPSELEPAVKIIYDLMEESVLVPFLNAVGSSRGPESLSNSWTSRDDVPDIEFLGATDDPSSSHHRRSPRRRDQSPPGSGSSMDVVDSSFRGPAPRPSHHSHLSAALSRSGSRLSAYLSQSSVSSPEAQDAGLTDDSASSPSNSGLEPMTPPTTPPTSDAGFGGTSPRTSPNPRGEGSGWKKMGAKLGWKRSRSTRGSSSGSSGKYPLARNSLVEDDENAS